MVILAIAALVASVVGLAGCDHEPVIVPADMEPSIIVTDTVR